MTNVDRPLSDKTDAELDIIIAKRVPSDTLGKQAREEKHLRQQAHEMTIQATQNKILSRTTIILWITVGGLIVAVIGVLVTFLK